MRETVINSNLKRDKIIIFSLTLKNLKFFPFLILVRKYSLGLVAYVFTDYLMILIFHPTCHQFSYEFSSLYAFLLKNLYHV